MHRVLVRVGEAYGAIKSVTWRDFELGRKTEIDAVTGEIVRRGEINGVDDPAELGRLRGPQTDRSRRANSRTREPRRGRELGTGARDLTR